MARRKRQPIRDALGDVIDEDRVRFDAARMAFVMADGVRICGDWNGPDGRWWERWAAKRPADDYAALTRHYLTALGRIGPAALETYERQLVRCRRRAAANTHAARAARQGGTHG